MYSRSTNNKSAMFSQQVAPRRIISLTPLIDVVFILLVFFMLASSFSNWNAIALDTTSKRDSSTPLPKDDVEQIVIDVQGSVLSMHGVIINIENLVNELTSIKKPSQSVNIRPLGDTNMQHIVQLLDVLAKAKISPLMLIEGEQQQALPKITGASSEAGKSLMPKVGV